MVKHHPRQDSKREQTISWIALVIGNTRLHWGLFVEEALLTTWHTPHLTQATAKQLQKTRFQADAWQAVAPSSAVDIPSAAASASEIWIASAVPAQLALWSAPTTSVSLSNSLAIYKVQRSHIPLGNVYDTLGIDRAINLLGAGEVSGWPVVVVDAGTALTFTAGTQASGQPSIYGGAILPGLRLQRDSLAQKTAVLGAHIPDSNDSNLALPTRWAMDTEGAIASGLIYSITATLIDYLTDWWQRFPTGKAILTGGDAQFLHHYLQQRALQQKHPQLKTPEVASRVLISQELMFYGMQRYRRELMLF